MLHILTTLAFAASAHASPVAPVPPIVRADSAELRREPLMAALKRGGYTVILRHARTDYSFKEAIDVIPKERSMQRNLSDDGFKDAALMGVVFRKYGIAFAEIVASPMFRTVETAEMAAGTPKTSLALRVLPSTAETEALVKAAPKPGTNRLIVTHHFVIETFVPGIKPGDIGESEAAVVRPTADGKIQLVGRITLDDWQELANPAHKAQAAAAAAAGPATVSHGAAPNTAATPHAAIPDTHAAHLAHDYVDAFNSGDSAKMRAFIETSMVADPARPTDERLKTFAKLFEQHGPLSLVRIDSSSALRLVATMKSKVGNVTLTVQASEAAPMRVSSLTLAYGEHR